MAGKIEAASPASRALVDLCEFAVTHKPAIATIEHDASEEDLAIDKGATKITFNFSEQIGLRIKLVFYRRRGMSAKMFAEDATEIDGGLIHEALRRNVLLVGLIIEKSERLNFFSIFEASKALYDYYQDYRGCGWAKAQALAEYVFTGYLFDCGFTAEEMSTSDIKPGWAGVKPIEQAETVAALPPVVIRRNEELGRLSILEWMLTTCFNSGTGSMQTQLEERMPDAETQFAEALRVLQGGGDGGAAAAFCDN